jgi:hypothetical protein
MKGLNMSRKSKNLLLVIIIPVLVSLACNFSAGGTDSDAESVPTGESSGTIRTIPTTESGAEPTSLPAIASSSSSSDSMSEDTVLVMKEPIFIQDETNLITVFVFENTDTNAGIEEIEYTVIASDADGVTIKTETGFIEYLPAGERTGVASQMFLEEGQVVEFVDIEWTYYTDASGSVDYPFTFENPHYYFDTFWDRFTTVMVNNSSTTFTNVRVDMIAYDSAGIVIGGGYTTVNIVPGNNQVGLSINGFVSNDPVTYEFFPRYSILTSEVDDANLLTDLTVLKSGFFFNETTLGGGFLVQNTTDEVLKSSQYYFTIYEEDGTVAQVASGYIDLIWPGQTQGVSPGSVSLSEGANPNKFDVFVLAGNPEEDELPTNPLTAQDVTFVSDDFFPRVSVTIANAHSEIIENPFVTVLLYNAQDEIIGGGYTYPDPIPANGSLTYEVYVTHVTAEPPARIEAFPTMTGW